MTKATTQCGVEGCDRMVHCRQSGYCSLHYKRWKRHGDSLTTKTIKGDDEARFWSKVDRRSSDECWPWTGSRHRQGYGQIRINGKEVLSHRYAFFLENRLWPEPVCLHVCDNPPCVNPAHLRQGTHTDNMQDMSVKGRHANLRGQQIGTSKLLDVDVMAIKRKLASDVSDADIASEYGISSVMVGRIRRGQNWAHIDPFAKLIQQVRD